MRGEVDRNASLATLMPCDPEPAWGLTRLTWTSEVPQGCQGSLRIHGEFLRFVTTLETVLETLEALDDT